MTTILVTGATGTVGRQVVTALARAGVRVRAGVRNPQGATDLADAGAELVALDFGDAAAVAAAVQGVDRIFLLTPFVEDATPMVSAVVDAAKAAGVSFILRMSAFGADPGSELRVARGHARAEQVVKDSGLGWAVLQPTFFMDNVINFDGASIRNEGVLYGAAGEGKASMLSTADLAAVAAAIVRDPSEHLGQTYVLTGGEALSDRDVAERVGQALGRSIVTIELSPEQHQQAMDGSGMPDWMVEALVGLAAVRRNGWAAAISPVVQTVLGRSPETLAAFLERNRARLQAGEATA